MEEQKIIIDLMNSTTYSGVIVSPSNYIFHSDFFIVDFHRAWFHVIREYKVIMTKRLRRYIDINYPSSEWGFKYYNPEDMCFYFKDEIKNYFPNRIKKKGSMNYLSLKNLVLTLVKNEWTHIDDVLDYMLEYEKILKKKD